MARLQQGLMLAAWLAAAGCQRHGAGSNEGVAVRQVLHGSDVLADIPTAATAQAAAAPSGGGNPGTVATTLVSDTPQAIYKQAGELARRQLESLSVRAALGRLDADMDQEQESAP